MKNKLIKISDDIRLDLNKEVKDFVHDLNNHVTILNGNFDKLCYENNIDDEYSKNIYIAINNVIKDIDNFKKFFYRFE